MRCTRRHADRSPMGRRRSRPARSREPWPRWRSEASAARQLSNRGRSPRTPPLEPGLVRRAVVFLPAKDGDPAPPKSARWRLSGPGALSSLVYTARDPMVVLRLGMGGIANRPAIGADHPGLAGAPAAAARPRILFPASRSPARLIPTMPLRGLPRGRDGPSRCPTPVHSMSRPGGGQRRPSDLSLRPCRPGHFQQPPRTNKKQKILATGCLPVADDPGAVTRERR